MTDWFYTNEFDASAVTEGEGIIFRKSQMEFAVNEEGTTYGSQLNDEYYGSPVDDTFKGNGGDDYFDGGLGTDIAIFSGNQANYSISTSISGLFETITISGTDGTDTLTNIETLRFDDGDVDVRPAGRTIKDSGQGIFAPISGDPIVGGTITAGAITDDPDGINSNPNIFYQWQEASYSSNTWTDISGATSSTYSPQAGDSNKTLRVKATYSDGTGISCLLYTSPSPRDS